MTIRRRHVVAAAVVPLLAAAGLAGGGALLAPGPEAVRRRAVELGARFGILIGTGDPADFFVPPWRPEDARIERGEALAVDLANLPPALDGIETSLACYPQGFYAGLCKAIFFCGGLTLDGAAAGGTFGPAWLILTANPARGPGGIYETARLGAHHEFSSLIWNRLADLPGAWSSQLPPGWVPAADNAVALQASDRAETAPIDGFLSRYGATTAENDFNVYAETIFPNPGRVMALAERYPVVARKAVLLMAAYTRIDPRMEKVFDALGLGRLIQAGGDPWRTDYPMPRPIAPMGRVVR